MRHVCHKLAACVIQTALLGDIVNDGDDAALAVQCAVRRQRDGQHAPKSCNLVRKEAARDGFVRIRHVQIGEHLIKAQLLLYTHAQQIFGCRFFFADFGHLHNLLHCLVFLRIGYIFVIH